MIRLFAVVLILFPSISFGCECIARRSNDVSDLLNGVSYYGYFDVIDVGMPNWSGDAPRILKASLKPAKQYGDTPPDVLNITSDLYTNCGKIVHKGKREQLLVFKNDTGYYLKGVCYDLTKEMWSSFDKKVLNYNDYYDYVAKFDYSKYVLSADKFKELSQTDGVVILDLRSKKEYDSGHVRGAVHIGSDITQDILEKVIPSKETAILTYCTNSISLTRTISLTDIALPQIHALGYNEAYSLRSAVAESDFDDGKRKTKLDFIYSKQ